MNKRFERDCDCDQGKGREMNKRFERWYRLTHWMSPEPIWNEGEYNNGNVVQAMFLAYCAGYKRAVKERKEVARARGEK